MPDLNEMKRDDLEERAKALGISGTSSMKKDELVEALEAQERAESGTPPPTAPAIPEGLAGATPSAFVTEEPPVVPQEPGVYRDDQYTHEQLINEAPDLFGEPSFFVRVALRHYGGDDSYLTLPEAQAAVDQLKTHSVEG